ncbi:MAG TPA: TonB-dependent receptor [Myxococcaceae bacterium]|jgi:hypothetical protein
MKRQLVWSGRLLAAWALVAAAPALAQNRTATIVVDVVRLQQAPAVPTPAPEAPKAVVPETPAAEAAATPAAVPAEGAAPEAPAAPAEKAAPEVPVAPAAPAEATPAPAAPAAPAAMGSAGVTATSLDSGEVTRAVPRRDGSYILTALEPGSYLLTASSDGKEVYQEVTAGVGQTLRVKMDMATEAQGETVVVRGHLVDNATSEVAMNVSREQMDNLPQSSRNFINFTALAPGVHQSADPFKKVFSSGATDATAINVFVDGVSLKQNVIDGGLVGQDSSRGNPFPQLALSGFRLITQNYKAEYEQAGGAVVVATTRSGGKELHGELLATGQNQYLLEQDYFSLQRGEAPAELGRAQLAAALSGPIPLLKDRLFFFATYEGNYEQRDNRVSMGNPTPENQARFGAYEGAFPSPFREHLAFGKLTWLPADGQTLDLTTSYRTETDIRSFGGTTSYQASENVKNNTFTASARHEWHLPQLTNEATAQFLVSHFNPVVQNDKLVGQDFQGVIRIGGRDTNQDISQRAFTLRDDATLPTIDALGPHVVKAGAKLSFQHYQEFKRLNGNPLFRYRIDSANGLDFSFPFEASYGTGSPLISTDNTQLGLYVQDDWQPVQRLTVNAGVRWDVETAPLNNGYVTPSDVRFSVLRLQRDITFFNGADWFQADRYLTDGKQRPPFLGAIQPRLGLAFDVLGDGSTMLFGGAGRYYDRTLYNTVVDEPYRLRYRVRTFRFSSNGAMRDGLPTIPWRDSYLSKDGLDGLIANGTAPSPEIFLIQNDLKPMHTDQFSGGLRRVLGPMNVSVTGTYVHGENGVGFYPANRKKDSPRDFIPVLGFGNVLVSDNNRESWYKSFQILVEKPFSADLSGGGVQWGGTISYTLGSATERGLLFNFDFPDVKSSPETPTVDDETHHLVLAATVGLPWSVKGSTLITLGSGLPYDVSDASAGWASFVFKKNGGRAPGLLNYSQVDFRFTKEFTLPTSTGEKAVAFAECFNLFNAVNFKDYDGFIPPLTDTPNANFGKPRQTLGPPRSFQFGVSYKF